jgi:thymidylate kinase
MLAGSRRILWILGGLSRRRFHWAVPLRRVSPRGGICIAFLGSDGAGKSTVSSDTVAWLSQKLDVVPIYFGSGDGPSSVLRYPFLLARRAFDRGKSSADPVRRRSGVRGGLRSIAAVPWALSLSLEKRSKLRRMVRARNRGMIVVCDRFPQNQIANINDGPLLGRLSQSKWGIARALSRWEAVPYAEVQHETPDIVIKLVASPGVALSRRPEMTAEEIETRIGIVRSLRYPETVRVVEVDSDLPLEDVIGSVRSAIWAEL